MFTDEEFKKLEGRVANGKIWIWDQPGNWQSKDPLMKKAIAKWHMLSEACLKEAVQRGVITKLTPAHSKAWHEVKFREAFEKWQKTPKIRRGTDPRTLSRESFI